MRPTRREIELASEVNSLKIQIEFIKGQVSVIRETYIKIAKEALALAGEYKKENEEMKRLLKLISEETDCLATFQYADEIEKLIGGIMEDKAVGIGLKFAPQPCTLCGNNCRVSLLEQFKVRNGLCKEREQKSEEDEK